MFRSFIQLKSFIVQSEADAKQLDIQRGEHHQALFDDRLFKTRSLFLAPYVGETRDLVETLITEQKTGGLTPENAEYLTQKLLDQVTAIQLEFAAYDVRQKEDKPKGYYKKPISILYQDLAQHQEWERRLLELVRIKEQQIKFAPSSIQPDALKALINAEKRLERCVAAKTNIEKQIAKRERYK